MAIPESMFTRESLEKLRSPEKLDAMLKVTSSVGWMGLIAMAVLLSSVVLWAFSAPLRKRFPARVCCWMQGEFPLSQPPPAA